MNGMAKGLAVVAAGLAGVAWRSFRVFSDLVGYKLVWSEEGFFVIQATTTAN
jgi:hypothetical protein